MLVTLRFLVLVVAAILFVVAGLSLPGGESIIAFALALLTVGQLLATAAEISSSDA